MHLQSLQLYNFRIYEEVFFEFSPGVNAICGANGRGKTTLLEAIYFLMTGRSFRTAQASELIRHGASAFAIEAVFIKHQISQKLRVTYNGSERKVVYNSTPCSPLSLLGLLQGVVFHPDDAAIVKGSPAVRRQLLDMQLGQADPLYVHFLTRYERAMRQRNYLLRARTAVSIESWEHAMAAAASYIVKQRACLVRELENKAKNLYGQIGECREPLGLSYRAHGIGDKSPEHEADVRALFMDQYQRHRPKEMELGATLTGPHRDDLAISLNGKEARTFASEGQQRSSVVALRLAEWARLQEASLEKPLMLIDDPGMGLDSARRSRLGAFFGQLEQVFHTTTEVSSLSDNAHLIAI